MILFQAFLLENRMLKHYYRKQAKRYALAAIGDRARILVQTHTIKDTLALLPGISRATLYRAMRLSLDKAAKDTSEAMRAMERRPDDDIDPLLL
jgi:hypothetical protein